MQNYAISRVCTSLLSYWGTGKHIYNDHAYNEMMLIMKHLFLYKIYAYSEVAYNKIMLLTK